MLQLSVCRDIEHLGSLESIQEGTVALGCASNNSDLRYVIKCHRTPRLGLYHKRKTRLLPDI